MYGSGKLLGSRLTAADTLKHNQFKSKEQFEKHFQTCLTQESYPPGTLVLVRNNAIEKSLDRKSKDQYNGPYEVVRKTQGGSYILKELSRNGPISKAGIVAFRLIPYIS